MVPSGQQALPNPLASPEMTGRGLAHQGYFRSIWLTSRTAPRAALVVSAA